jgi:GNAT superfamily N-acetyltransferase
MSPIYPNIVPENNLRLPDALTIKHGPREPIVSVVLRGDRAARDQGIRLRLRHDFDGLLALTRFETARRNWYRVADYFNPELNDLTPENSYWISGENQSGEIVTTVAARVYHWPSSSLADEARSMFYAGRDSGRACAVTTPAASEINGVVLCSGAMWVRPDYRRMGFSHLMPRVSRAYAAARWPLDWAFIFVMPGTPEALVRGYGYRDVTASISFPGSPWGDLDFRLARLSRRQIYDDLEGFLLGTLSAGASSGRKREQTVISTSPDGVLQGSINLS